MNEIDLLTSHDPASAPLPQTARDLLLLGLQNPFPRPPRRWRLTVLALTAGVLTAGTGGLAYAVLSGQAPTTALKVNCAVGTTEAEFVSSGFTTIIDVHTADPVADCASEYERLGLPVPALRAYTTGTVFLSVVPQSWRVPESWHPLAADFRSDASRLVLKQRLDDPVDGPGAECRSTAAVHDAIQHEISQLGLAGWSIEPAPGATEADGKAACAFAWVDEGAQKKVLVQSGPPFPHDGDDTALLRLLARLRSDIANRCLTMAEAKAAAERALAETSIPAAVSTAPGAAARCTAVDVVPGGALTIRLS